MAESRQWDLLSKHGLALLTVAQLPHARISEIASALDLTGRACQRILSDLVVAGYVSRRRVGRRNEYVVDQARPMLHPLLRHYAVGDLMGAFVPGGEIRGTVAAPTLRSHSRDTAEVEVS